MKFEFTALTLAEFRKSYEDNRPKAIILDASNETNRERLSDLFRERDEIQNFQYEFHFDTLLFTFNPNRIVLKCGKDMVCLNRVEGIFRAETPWRKHSTAFLVLCRDDPVARCITFNYQ